VQTSFKRAINFVAVTGLVAAGIAGAGIAPANAAEVNFQGVHAVTTATGSGRGSLTLSSPGPLQVFVNAGGSFAGGAQEATVEANGVLAYTCTGSSNVALVVRLPVKGGLGFDISGPCGPVVQPPASTWNQSATIHPGADGSGNADVVFNNTESNQTGGFYVTIGGGEPTSATSVAAGQTKSIPVHAEPGTVIRVYGTKDGKATPKLLKELTLPKAPAAPAPPDANTPIVPAANQPVPVTNTAPRATRNEWKRPVFDTAANGVSPQAINATATLPSQGVSPWAMIGFGVAAFAAIYLISKVVVCRRDI
jgi:hypothetical protein